MLSSLSKHKGISSHWVEFDLWLFHKCRKYILITLAPNLFNLSHYPHFLLFSTIYDIHVFLFSHTHWVQPGLSVGLWVWICLCSRSRNTLWIHNWKQWQTPPPESIKGHSSWWGRTPSRNSSLLYGWLLTAPMLLVVYKMINASMLKGPSSAFSSSNHELPPHSCVIHLSLITIVFHLHWPYSKLLRHFDLFFSLLRVPFFLGCHVLSFRKALFLLYQKGMFYRLVSARSHLTWHHALDMTFIDFFTEATIIWKQLFN